MSSARVHLVEPPSGRHTSVEDVEVRLLLEGICATTGSTSANTASSLRAAHPPLHGRRGPGHRLRAPGAGAPRPGVAVRLMHGLTVNVTSMLRDPGFYRALRETVVPVPPTYPVARIWHAGCSTGAGGLLPGHSCSGRGPYPRCQIYATDMNERVLRRARAGIVPLGTMLGEHPELHRVRRAPALRAVVHEHTEGACRPRARGERVFAQQNRPPKRPSTSSTWCSAGTC